MGGMMRALLPLAVLALAACSPPMQELYPARFYSFARDGVPYELRAQYDPFERGWFVRVNSLTGPLPLASQGVVMAMMQENLAPAICDSGALAIKQGHVWNQFAAEEVLFLPELGAWQVVGRCADLPTLPQEVAVHLRDNAALAFGGAEAVVVGDGDPAAVALDVSAEPEVLIAMPED